MVLGASFRVADTRYNRRICAASARYPRVCHRRGHAPRHRAGAVAPPRGRCCLMGELRAVVELPATLRSAATARAVVRALLPAWGLGPVVDDAELVVSELVSNAVEHAPGS